MTFFKGTSKEISFKRVMIMKYKIIYGEGVVFSLVLVLAVDVDSNARRSK